jgi:hypothetical protein
MRQLVLALTVLGFTTFGFAKNDCSEKFSKAKPEDESTLVQAAIERAVSKEARLPTPGEVVASLSVTAKDFRSQIGGGSSWPSQLRQYMDDHGLLELSKPLQRLQEKLIKSWVQHLEQSHTPPKLEIIAEAGRVSVDVAKLLLGNEDHTWTLLHAKYERELEGLHTTIAKAYAASSKAHGRTLDQDEFIESYTGTKIDWIFTRKVFVDIHELRSLARQVSPKSFDEVIDLEIFNEVRTKNLLNAIKTKKRLLVTTAVAGAAVDRDFLQAAKTYCDANDAALIVIPANMKTNELDPLLLKETWVHILTNEVEISRFLRLSNIKITAKQFNPLTSLDNIGPRSQSVIVSSPKIHVKVVPTTNNAEHPHFLYSTGAITVPNYSGRLFIQKRTDYIAKNQHRMGALVLERVSASVESSDLSGFHARHIEYIPERRGFYDLDRFFGKEQVSTEAPLAMVLGDVHVAKLDRKAFERVKSEIKRLKPKVIVIHDNFDGDTVNGHTANQLVTRGLQAQTKNTSVAAELSGVIDFQNELLELDPTLELLVVRSNHDLWLDRWIQSGEFMRDPQNQAIGILLAEAMAVRGFSNPLEYAVKHLASDPRGSALIKSKLLDPKRVRFLNLGSSETIGPKGAEVLVGLHGHAGINGAKGISLKSLARIAGRSIKAHTHTVARENEAVNVGTLTMLDLEYNRDGVSNWVQSVAVIGPNGEIQVLAFKDGEFFATDANRKKRDFFDEEYPILVPNQLDLSTGQVDQYGE